MGLSRGDWMALTPKQYVLYRESFYKRQDRQERERWEVARWQVFRTLCPPDKKRIGLKDLIEFPWEGKAKAQAKDKERFEELAKLWDDGK